MAKISDQIDVFLSYAREDQELAKKLARILQKHRFSVWWDRELEAGTIFDAAIEQKLNAARSVMVLWSTHSASSRWVKKEAKIAKKAHKLIPVLLEEIYPPLGFKKIHACDLIGWGGSPRALKLREIIDLLEKQLYTSTQYFVPLDSLCPPIQLGGKTLSGRHLAKCLNKAPPERRESFMERYGILRGADERYLILVRDYYDERHVRRTEPTLKPMRMKVSGA